MKSHFVLLLICLGIAVSGSSQDNSLQRAAEKGLQDLRQLVAMENFQNTQLPTPQQLEKAGLGQPLTHHVIELEALKEYDPQIEPQRIIKTLDRATVPVMDAEKRQVIATIGLDNSKGEWQVGELGNQDYVRSYQTLLRKLDVRPEDAQLVSIPAFRLYFLATQKDRGEMQFALLGEQGFSDIRPGELQPARRVLEQLIPVARNYNGLPW